MMAQPQWINRQEYPFQGNTFRTEEGTLHYVDEGKGPVIIFLHGTPEWSFSYREVIKKFSASYRCLALDMLGFGLSDKPQQADYSVPAHAARLHKWIEHLNLSDITFVAGDFGGAMAIDYTLAHKENVKGLVLWNTWCRDLMQDKHFRMPANLLHTRLGKWLYRRLNFPVTVVMPRAYGDRKKLTKEIHLHYKAPLDSWANRIATHEIGKELKNASPWWQERWERMEELRPVSTMMVWGMKDTFIPQTELAHWKKQIPFAKFISMPDAGHWPYEEQPEVFGYYLKEFLNERN